MEKNHTEYAEVKQRISEFSKEILIPREYKGGELFEKIMLYYKEQLVNNALDIEKKEMLRIPDGDGAHHSFICDMIKQREFGSVFVMECLKDADQMKKVHPLDKKFMRELANTIHENNLTPSDKGGVKPIIFRWLFILSDGISDHQPIAEVLNEPVGNDPELTKDYDFYNRLLKCKFVFKYIAEGDFLDIVNNINIPDSAKSVRIVCNKVGNYGLDIGIYLNEHDSYIFDAGDIEEKNVNPKDKVWGTLIAKKKIIEFYKKLFNDAWKEAKNIT